MKKKVLWIGVLLALMQQQINNIHAHIIVEDDNGKGIQDVIFILKDENYHTIQLTTNQYGYIDTSHLPQANYKIKESQVPLQYEQQQVYYDYHPNENLKIVHKEKKGSVTLTIQNEENNPCINYEFIIYNAYNEPIKTIKTNEQGQIYLEDMKLGLYTLAYVGDENYDVNSDDLSFRITAYNYKTTMQLTYHLTKSSPTKINIEDLMSRIVVGIVCILVCIIFIIQFRKEYYSS